jgi:hypothetical protein
MITASIASRVAREHGDEAKRWLRAEVLAFRVAVALFGRLPFYPLLLAAYSVLFVYAANMSEVRPGDLLTPILWAVGVTAAVLVVTAVVLRDARRGALVTTALLVPAAFFGHVAPTLSSVGAGETAQLALWVILFVAVATYARRARGSLASVTAALNGFAIVLLGISLVTIVPFEAGRVVRASGSEPGDAGTTIAATRAPERDIYLLVFDRYGSDWSIRQRFGIENDLLPDLEAAGFQVLPGARASYRATDFSIASMLTMQTLDDLTASVGRASSDRTPAREKLQHHDVGRFLRANGYRYEHIAGWYEATYDNAIADEVLRYGKTTEFEGVLREASVFPVLDRVLGLAPVDTDFRDRHRNEALFAFRALRRIAQDPARTFTFAHILLPHPPYGFGADGRIILSEEEESRPEGELYAEQLAYTNERIRETVAALLAGPDEADPIIVITGDEGPFICGHVDCLDGSPEAYGIRFGTLRALYLPGIDIELPPDQTGVNIFRMILREYFGADLPDLPDRSYTWPDNDHLYDFSDITDLLPLPGGRASPGSGAGASPTASPAPTPAP